MTSLDKEDLIKQRNALKAENLELKQVNQQLRAINVSLAKQDCDNKWPDLVWLTRDELKELSDINQAGGINAIKADAIEEAVDKLEDNINFNDNCWDTYTEEQLLEYAKELRSD